MSPSLRWLVWLAVLIAGWSVVLDWQDELAKLQPERERLERLRQREQSAISAVNWSRLSQEAAQAQLAWLERLPPVVQTGVFRAEAMEGMADLCTRLDAPCQVSAMGETASSRAPVSGGASQGRGSASEGAPDELPGLVSTSVRVTTGLGDKLAPLLREIENGPVLRRVERFTVRSGRADFGVKTYGLDHQSADALMAAAQRQASEGRAIRAGGENTAAGAASANKAVP